MDLFLRITLGLHPGNALPLTTHSLRVHFTLLGLLAFRTTGHTLSRFHATRVCLILRSLHSLGYCHSRSSLDLRCLRQDTSDSTGRITVLLADISGSSCLRYAPGTFTTTFSHFNGPVWTFWVGLVFCAWTAHLLGTPRLSLYCCTHFAHNTAGT